ncbi:MAG TPA: Gfo/Idh/MocA family oxidoreductase [Vicinamibacterales bacterium]|nr:Gfo/Idh/MocA family oxidoreductase [Vicinamibacterales bacterium]
MKRIGMGLVGAGFVGPHHIDAVRRLGFVDVVAIAASTETSARAKADALGVPKAYGTYEALIDDKDVQVVHNATPNHLHYQVNAAAIARGKHIVSDKPLATTSGEARALLDQARAAGVVHAVTFNYRGNPLVQQARHMIGRGDIGRPHFVHGFYLQDWLLNDTDYSWRLEPDKGGPTSALGDIGSHWCDLAQHVTGLRIREVLADVTIVVPQRRKPSKAREAFQAGSGAENLERVDMTLEDLASVIVRFDNGARGVFSVGQVCAGHKNDLQLEVCGATGSVKWRQEQQNELWIGRRDSPNQALLKDPSLIDEPARRYAHLPGGHQESWADAFCNVMRDIYGVIAAGDARSADRPPAFATFEDGYRATCNVDAILASAKAGGTWTKVSD